MKNVAIIIFIALLFSCSSNGNNYCTEEFVYGLNIIVKDAVTDVILTEELQRVNLPPHAERISSSNCTGKTTSDNRDDTEEEEGNSYKYLEREHCEEEEKEEEKVPDR